MPELTTIDEKAAACFAAEVAGLEMRTVLDAGLHRHLRFRHPTSGLYWFDLVTWPNALAVRGDLDGFMFAAGTTDMFAFFRESAWNGRPNVGYWAEKADDPARTREYSEELFRQRVLQDVHERRDERPPGLFAALQEQIFTLPSPWFGVDDRFDISFEDGARSAVDAFKHDGFGFGHAWEWDLRDYTWHFRRACHAVLWGIGQYDAAKKQDGGGDRAV